jgi:hypothetical protein
MAKVVECPYGCGFRTRDAMSLRVHIIQSHSKKEKS